MQLIDARFCEDCVGAVSTIRDDAEGRVIIVCVCWIRLGAKEQENT